MKSKTLYIKTGFSIYSSGGKYLWCGDINMGLKTELDSLVTGYWVESKIVEGTGKYHIHRWRKSKEQYNALKIIKREAENNNRPMGISYTIEYD